MYLDIDDEEYHQTLALYRRILGEKDEIKEIGIETLDYKDKRKEYLNERRSSVNDDDLRKINQQYKSNEISDVSSENIFEKRDSTLYLDDQKSEFSFLTNKSHNSILTKNITVLDKRNDNEYDTSLLLQKAMKMKKNIIDLTLKRVQLRYASLVFVTHNETQDKYSFYIHELYIDNLFDQQELYQQKFDYDLLNRLKNDFYIKQENNHLSDHQDKHRSKRIHVYPPNTTKSGDVISIYMICFVTNSYRMENKKYDIAKFECLNHFSIPLCDSSNKDLNIVNFGSRLKYAIDMITKCISDSDDQEKNSANIINSSNKNDYYIRCKYKRRNISCRNKNKNKWYLYYLHVSIFIKPFVNDLKDVLCQLELDTIHDKKREILTNKKDELYDDISKMQQEQLELYQKLAEYKSRIQEKKKKLVEIDSKIDVFDREWENYGITPVH